MAKQIKFTVTEKWEEISQKFCDFQGLPHGSAFKIVYTGTNARSERVQKSNTRYDRAEFRKGSPGYAGDGLTIRALIDDYLMPYVDFDLKSKKAKIVAFYPDGNSPEANTLLRTWRSEPGLMTDEMVDAENELEARIDALHKEVKRAFNSLTEAKRDHEKTMPRAVLRELLRRYGLIAVESGLKQETLR